MGQDLTDLEIMIHQNRVSFRLNNNDYADPHHLGDDVVEQLVDIRRSGHAQEYGSLLLRSTFVGQALDGYRQIQSAIDEATFLRVRLNIDPNAARLHTLRWECLQDFEEPIRRLGCSQFTPLSRYLPLTRTRARVRDQTLRVLVAIASPKDLGKGKWQNFKPLQKEAEWKTIDESLEYFGERVQFERQASPASFRAIRERLEGERFHVLHLIAHGGYRRDDPNRPEQGYLLLEQDDNELAVPVTDNLLGDLVMDLPDLQLVVLAACHSADRSDADAFVGMAPRMIRSGVPAVVAMQELVSFDTAHRFAERFYHSLGYESLGRVDIAINHARHNLYFADPSAEWDWSIPVLFMRGDGQLFEPADAQAPAEARPSVISVSLGTPVPLGVSQPDGGIAEVIQMTALSRSLDKQFPEPHSEVGSQTDRPAVQLFERMNQQRFSEEDLEDVCFRIEVDFDIDPDRSYTQNVRRLIRYCENYGKFDALWREIARRLVSTASLNNVG
jgi:CHAT domain/Effector-associated domain 7